MPFDDAATAAAILLCDPASIAALRPVCARAGVAVEDASRFEGALDHLSGADAVAIIGAVALSEEEAARLETICDAINAIARFEPVELLRLEAGPVDEAALLPWLVRRLLAGRETLMGHYAETRLAMAELRMGYERMALAFDELERKSAEFTIPERVLVGQVDGKLDGDAGRLRLAPHVVVAQALPLVASGLSGIDLFLTDIGDGEGDLALGVTAAGRDLTIAEARLAARDLKPGWRSLEFDRALISDETRIELRVTWTGAAVDAPSLRLGLATPLPAYMVRVGGEPREAVLAFKAWRRPPGARRGAPTAVEPVFGSLTAEPAKDASAVGSVIAPDMEQVIKDATPRSLKPTDRLHALVATKKHLTGVMIHPQKDNVVALSWPLVEFAELSRIAARFKLEHVDGPPVDVALSFARAEDIRTALKNLDGWITLGANESGVIALDAPADYDPASHVLLAASRLNADAKTHVNAWAYLKRLTVWTLR